MAAASTTDGVNVVFGANIEGLLSGCKQAQAAVLESTEAMKGALEALSSGLEVISKGFAALTAVVAGGKLFGDAVAATAEYYASVLQLSKMLGTTQTDASVYKSALVGVGASSQEGNAEIMGLSRTLQNNEQAFGKLGVATREANGEFRPMNEIMLDVNEKFGEMADGTGKNVAMAAIFGRQWRSVGLALNVSKEAMEEANATAAALGLTVTTQGVASAKAYKIALGEMKEVMEALEKAIGDALMPVLTELGNFFALVGPLAVKLMKGAIGGLAAVFWGLQEVVVTVFKAVVGVIYSVTEPILATGQAIYLALTGHWDQAKERMNQATLNIKNFWVQTGNEIIANSEKVRDKLWNLFADGDPTKQKAGTKPPDLSDHPKPPSQMPEFEAQLSALKENYAEKQRLQGSFKEWSLQQDADYWQNLLDHTKMSTDDQRKVTLKLNADKLAMDKKAFTDKIALIDEEAAASNKDLEHKRELLMQEAALMGTAYGDGSAQQIAALKKVDQVSQQIHDAELKRADEIAEAMKTSALSELQVKSDALDREYALDQITNEELLKGKRALIAAEEQLELNDLEAKKAMYQGDADQQAKIDGEIAKTKAKYAQDAYKNQTQLLQEQDKDYKQFGQDVAGTFDTMIDSLLKGTATWKQAMQTAFTTIAEAFVKDLVTKQISTWIASETTKTAATVAGNAERTLSDTGAAAESTAVSAESTLSIIAMKAWQAAASVYASIAAIPYVGPFLAPAAAVAAAGVVIGYGAHIMSAEGGYDIPSGVNPMTQLHENEMVLPSEHADTIRGLSGAGAGGSPIHIHGSPNDTMTMNELAKMLKKMGRNFTWSKDK